MIFHIISRTAWDNAQQRGEYHAESLSTEGFIHCSTFSQVLPVAENFYKGQSGLILLMIEPSLLSSTLKWESPSGGIPPPGAPEDGPFPHIYGSLNLNAVVKVLDLEKDSHGAFILPNL
jgi:uncharacterized protein (DUF952 family)